MCSGLSVGLELDLERSIGTATLVSIARSLFYMSGALLSGGILYVWYMM